MAIFAGFYYLATLHDGSSDALVVASFLFITVALIPLSSFLTLLIGKIAIPFFKVELTDLKECTTYLTAWLFIALILFSLLKLFAFLILGAGFGGGMPRMRMTNTTTSQQQTQPDIFAPLIAPLSSPPFVGCFALIVLLAILSAFKGRRPQLSDARWATPGEVRQGRRRGIRQMARKVPNKNCFIFRSINSQRSSTFSFCGGKI
ncbi:MAG: hypothetical protein HC820_04985 [Hydrococcus sp. RM1_1_31]|nr:hypothetical protein [Hydrococcus sp. RM1_1_31]